MLMCLLVVLTRACGQVQLVAVQPWLRGAQLEVQCRCILELGSVVVLSEFGAAVLLVKAYADSGRIYLYLPWVTEAQRHLHLKFVRSGQIAGIEARSDGMRQLDVLPYTAVK